MTATDAGQIEHVSSAFAERIGRPPTGVWAAPGRVNLIGEHTDYNDGYVMPFALPQAVTIAAADRTDGRWSVTSLDEGDPVTFGPEDLQPGATGWGAYVQGVVWALREAHHAVPGADLVLSSDVPMGAGLSSSAALECAVLAALADLGGLHIGGLDRAVLARRAENAYVGAPTGLMDQAASTLCTEGHALFFDCRTLATEQIPFADRALEVLVLDTNTPHAHVDSEYAARRATCEEAAGILGVAALRDIGVDELDAALSRLPDDVMRRRVRHVVTEDQRVLDAADVLRAGRTAELAPLLDASHVSMRDDFAITVPTVDLAVETARSAGALGARMTGGGFGGCIIALCPAGTTDAVGTAVATAFARAGHAMPRWFTAAPSAGARRLR